MTTAIFSLIHGVLLQELTVADPEQVVFVRGQVPSQDQQQMLASLPEIQDYAEQAETFSHVAGAGARYLDLVGEGEPERLIAGRVTAGFFDLLGVDPALGQAFVPEDEDRGRGNVVVLSHGLWERRFGSDANIVGRKLTLADEPFEVIGVMPEGFRFRYGSFDHELWVPVFRDMERRERDFRTLNAVARLRDGRTVESAQAEMDALARNLRRQYPDVYPEDQGIAVVSAQDEAVEDVRGTLWVLFALVGAVLLIACVNVANLSLARGAERQRELTLRTVLGASRKHLLRQLILESAVLAVLGAVGGLLLAQWLLRTLQSINPDGLPRLEDVHLSGPVLLFTLGVTLLALAVTGVLPALKIVRRRPKLSLRETERAGHGRSRRLAPGLVVAETALALVVLVAAGGLVQQFLAARDLDPGFETDGATTFQIYMSPTRYTDDDARIRFLDRVAEELDALPQVQAAGVVSGFPLTEIQFNVDTEIEGQPIPAGQAAPLTDLRIVGGEYFRAMGMDLVDGRVFGAEDRGDTLPVAVVDQGFAERFWPGESAIGRRVRILPVRTAADDEPWRTVIGVVEPVRSVSLDQDPPEQVYTLYRQPPVTRYMAVVLRSDQPGDVVLDAARRAIWRVDPNQPVENAMAASEVVAESISGYRLYALLMGLAAVIALVLAAAGVYSVMANATARRSREIAVRMAIGAEPRSVLRQIITRGLALGAFGVAVGFLMTLASGRLFAFLVPDAGGLDGKLVLLGILVLLGTALTASFVPALRAMRTDPAVVLRQD